MVGGASQRNDNFRETIPAKLDLRYHKLPHLLQYCATLHNDSLRFHMGDQYLAIFVLEWFEDHLNPTVPIATPVLTK